MQWQSVTTSDWDLDNIPLETMVDERIRARKDQFYLVAAASFIESGTDLYSNNLARFVSHDTDLVEWLKNRWRAEELRHGRALRAYVCHVWPEFDWERAYTAFLADYAQLCAVDEFEPTPCLELAARCVIETGTATFYQALAAQAPEPILAGIAWRIRNDEINHYKHFYRYFRAYKSREAPGRLRILAALGRRTLEARRGDGACAIRHVYTAQAPTRCADPRAFNRLNRQLGQHLRAHYPTAMAAKMLLKLLDLPGRWSRILEQPLSRAIDLALR